jgi:hypothetical protein
MTDEQNPELTWEQQQQQEQDAATRRAATIQAEVHEQRLAEKREKKLSTMSQSEWRSYISEKYGYDPG